MSTLSLALTRGSSPTRKQFEEIVHWFKQIIGIILGITFGLLKLQGILAIIGGVVLISVISIVYGQNYLECDEDEVENTHMITDAFMISFFCFLVRPCVTLP